MSRAAAVSVALIAACSGEPDLEIDRNRRPLADTCERSTDAGGTIERGTFDLAIGDRSSYVLTPVVRNHTDDDARVDTARIDVEVREDGAWAPVRVRCDLGELCDRWDLPLCDGADREDCPYVPASRAASFDVPILPRVVTSYYQSVLDEAVLAGRTPPEFELRANVTLRGQAGGGSIRSDAFAYDVTLCLGCLVEFPAAVDSDLPGPDCCASGAPPDGGCLPGQDDAIDCRLCRTTSPEVCNFGRLSCAR